MSPNLAPMNPFVSVVVPNYNHAHFLGRALQSILDQTVQSWEALVIDNHSSDNTDFVVKSFNDPRIVLLKIHNNGVIGASRNLGIRNARGVWIAFLDADDCWYPTKLETALRAAGEHGGYDVICNNELVVDHAKKARSLLCFGPYEQDFYRVLLLQGNRLSPSATMVRLDILARNGISFSEAKEHITVEDYDLWLQLARSNARFRFIDDVLGEYHLHGNNASSRLETHLANAESLLRKHLFCIQQFSMRPIELWPHVAFRLAVTRVRNLEVHDQTGVEYRDLLRLVRNFPSVVLIFISQRAQLAARRAVFRMKSPIIATGLRLLGKLRRTNKHHDLLHLFYPGVMLASSIGQRLGLLSPNRLRVLALHDIPPSNFDRFATQLRWLARYWTFVTPEAFAAMVSGRQPIRGYNLLLTFDDGLASNRAVAEQVLNPMGIRAIFFVVSGLVDIIDRTKSRAFIAHNIYPDIPASALPAHWYGMGWEDLRALLEQGHCIGSHTTTHSRLSLLYTDVELEKEIVAGADLLELRLGVPIEHFAYSFGNLNSFSEAGMAVALRRFRFIYSGLRGNNALRTSPFAVRRDAASTQDKYGNYHLLSNFALATFLEGAMDFVYFKDVVTFSRWGHSDSPVAE